MTACPNSHHFDFINDNVVESKQKKKKKKEWAGEKKRLNLEECQTK
jgi:hypothetical protein